MKRRAKIYKVNDYVTCIDDDGISVCYVVCGKNKAAVIDTLNGIENLKDIVREITDLPLIVINTHGHCDHVYGNTFFEKAFIHPDDVEVHDRHFDDKKYIGEERAKEFGATLKELEIFKNALPCPLEFIREGDIVDLGGVQLEVIGLCGHTKGSIGLLDRKSGYFFSGDALNEGLWMQLPESIKLCEYKEVLKKLEPYRPYIKELHTGHNKESVSPNMIDYVIECIDDLYANGGEKDETREWFQGVAKVHNYKNIMFIWYVDEKL